jgi:hypothetical protein
MTHNNSISMIDKVFANEPGQWGLRGDPYLWEELREDLKYKKEPATEAELESTLTHSFEKLTGQTLSPGKEFFLEKLSHGGMSSGYVSCDFWLQRGFPLLLEGFRKWKVS